MGVINRYYSVNYITRFSLFELCWSKFASIRFLGLADIETTKQEFISAHFH